MSNLRWSLSWLAVLVSAMAVLPASLVAPPAVAADDAEGLLRRADDSRARGLHEGVVTFRMRQYRIQSDGSRVASTEGTASRAVIRVYLGAAGGTADDASKGPQLVVFEEPGSLRGTAFLVVGANTWMYKPGLRNPLRISAQQRAFGDAAVGEAAGILFATDYRVVASAAEVLEGTSTRRLDLEARSLAAPYRKATVWVDPQQGLYRRAVLYSVSGMALKQLDYEAWGEVSGRFALVRLAVQDLLQSARRTVTVLETLDIADRAIPAHYFRPEFLSSAALLLGR